MRTVPKQQDAQRLHPCGSSVSRQPPHKAHGYSAKLTELLCGAGFEDTEVPPKLFVLMGNFQSDAGSCSGFAAVRENFNALAALLRTFRLFRVRLSGQHVGCGLMSKLKHRAAVQHMPVVQCS